MGLIKRIICAFIGHNYSYNFGWMPTKCNCKRCGAKWKVVSNPEYNGKNLMEEPIYIWEKDKTKDDKKDDKKT